MLIAGRSTWWHAMGKEGSNNCQYVGIQSVIWIFWKTVGREGRLPMARQRDKDSKDIQQLDVIKDTKWGNTEEAERILRRTGEWGKREGKKDSGGTGKRQMWKGYAQRKPMWWWRRWRRCRLWIQMTYWWNCGHDWKTVPPLTSSQACSTNFYKWRRHLRNGDVAHWSKLMGDAQSCSNYRGIKLMSTSINIWDRVIGVGWGVKLQYVSSNRVNAR